MATELTERQQGLIDKLQTPVSGGGGAESARGVLGNILNRIETTQNPLEMFGILKSNFPQQVGTFIDNQTQQAVRSVARKRLSDLTDTPEGQVELLSPSEIKLRVEGTRQQREITELGEEQAGQISEFADEFLGRAATRRESLAEILSGRGQSLFQQTRPERLELLQSRGFGTSESAIAQAETRAIQELETERSGQLAQFDIFTGRQEEQLRGSSIEALLGGTSGGLEQALDLRRSGIERQFQEQDIAREQGFVQSLARKRRRGQLTSSLIQAGGNIIGSLIGR